MSTHRRYYRPELDVLRCLAFLLVFILHSSVFPSGWLAQVRMAGASGLCLFFFLSAFLITELLDREKETTGTVQLGAFYMRRMLRIWPLYIAAILFDFIHARLTTPQLFSGPRLAAYLLLIGNWYTAKRGLIGSLTMPLWSISVEEQFYVLWPSVRRNWSRKVAIATTIGTLAVSVAALAYESWHAVDTDTTVWVNSFVQFQFFATGALSALLLKHRIPNLSGWQRGMLFATGLAAFYCAQAIFHLKTGTPHAELSFVLPAYLLVNLGCIAVFLSFLGSQLLGGVRPLVYLGKISYGLYVFHYAMLIYCSRAVNALQLHLSPGSWFDLRALFALPCTVILAHLSYQYFEAPLLRYKRRFEVIRTRPVES